MVHLYIADVGDGLAAGIRTVSGSTLQIDCGSQQSPAHACRDGLKRIFPDSFFLSHFHSDHYNGLFRVGLGDKFDIRRAFFPRLPDFKDRQVFMVYLLAMTYRVMGGRSGSMEVDFLDCLSQVTRSNFTYRRLSAGDTVDVEGAHFEVLWPPKTLDDKTTSATVGKAIADFSTALQEDAELRRLHEQVSGSHVVEPYLRNNSDEVSCRVEERATRAEQPVPPSHLPEVVVRANGSLRAAANHMSLALYEDNRFLFLGDLEKQELKQVAAELVRRGRTNFLATITPHHGTHWHSDLARVRTLYAISSVGEKLIRKFRPEFKSFGRRCLVTHSNGEIHVPSAPNWGYVDPSLCWSYR